MALFFFIFYFFFFCFFVGNHKGTMKTEMEETLELKATHRVTMVCTWQVSYTGQIEIQKVVNSKLQETFTVMANK